MFAFVKLFEKLSDKGRMVVIKELKEKMLETVKASYVPEFVVVCQSIGLLAAICMYILYNCI